MRPQTALGVSTWACSEPQPPAPPPSLHEDLRDLVHDVESGLLPSGAQYSPGVLARDAKRIKQEILGFRFGKSPPPVAPANATCRATPGPFFAYDFVRNGTAGGEYTVVPPPPVPPGMAPMSGRGLAEIDAEPLDSTVVTGSVPPVLPL